MIRLHSSIIAISVMSAATVLTACATRTGYVDLYGQSVPVSSAERTIVITPSTKYVNVEGGQTIKFVVGDKEFAWNFFVARTVSNFALNDIAPSGVLDRPVRFMSRRTLDIWTAMVMATMTDGDRAILR